MVTDSETKKGYQARYETHRWHCTKGCFNWYLNVDNKDPLDKIKLNKFETEVTLHVLKTQHEVIHKQAETFNNTLNL